MSLRFVSLVTGGAAALVIGTSSGAASAQPVPATRILGVGDTPAGVAGMVVSLGYPTINGDGSVGFNGVAGDVFIWNDGGVAWTNGDAIGFSLSGVEQTMGISDGGGFIYGTDIDGRDGLWTHLGYLIRADDPAPGILTALTTFNDVPLMLPDGAIRWVAGYDDDSDGLTDGRVLYASQSGLIGDATILLQSGDVIGGLTIADDGIERVHAVSSDGAHTVLIVDFDTGSTADDTAVVVDGAIVQRESLPNGSGDNWDNFDLVTINDAGNFLVSGDTDGPSGSDEHIAYQAGIAVREGDVVAGVTLASSVRGVSINNRNQAVWAWTTAVGEAVFLACDASDLASSELLVATMSTVDLDNDGSADATITDLNAVNSVGNGTTLGDDGQVYLNVDIDDGAAVGAAILRFDVACCGDAFVAPSEDCDEGETMTCDSDCTFAQCGDGTVNATALEVCDDGGESASCDADCTAASCGDGTTNTTAGEECDDSGESAACDDDCTFAMCGDGVVNASAAETCDDVGESVTCDIDCTAAECGDGVLNTTAGEACDEGGATPTCNADCSLTECGDGIVNAAAGEECDDAGESASCDADCTLPECGDGLHNATAGEECDDGGPSDECNEDCTLAGCGDGIVNEQAGEQCDDGGETATCDADCTFVICGDAVLNETAGEICDDGLQSIDCDDDCTLPECGDGNGNEAAGELCDDGGDSSNCDADCTFVECGDEHINEAAGELCDDGTDTASCDGDCTEPACGDGWLNVVVGEQCDDGNQIDGDGCRADCTAEPNPSTGAAMAPLPPMDEGSCGCRTAGGDAPRSRWGWAIAIAAAALGLRRRVAGRRASR